jgi:hypothetical protein
LRDHHVPPSDPLGARVNIRAVNDLSDRANVTAREATMVLSKSELIAALQNEVHILLHLASKVDRTQLDYRPAPRQRSTIELLYESLLVGVSDEYLRGEIEVGGSSTTRGAYIVKWSWVRRIYGWASTRRAS